MGMIPKTITSEKKIYKSFTIGRILGMLMVLVLSLTFGTFLNGGITILFLISNILIYFVMTGNDPVIPNKKFYAGWLTFFKHKREEKTYIYTEEKDNENINKAGGENV